MTIDVRLSAFGPGLSVPAAVAAGCFARYVVTVDGLCRGGRAPGSDSWAASQSTRLTRKFRASRSRLNGPRGWIVETEPKKHPAATAAGTDHPTADISLGFRLLLPIAYCLPLFSTNNHGLHSCECRTWNVVRCHLSSWPTMLA